MALKERSNKVITFKPKVSTNYDYSYCTVLETYILFIFSNQTCILLYLYFFSLFASAVHTWSDNFEQACQLKYYSKKNRKDNAKHTIPRMTFCQKFLKVLLFYQDMSPSCVNAPIVVNGGMGAQVKSFTY